MTLSGYLARQRVVTFEPGKLQYNRGGELFSVWFEDQPAYVDSLGDIVVYRARADNRIIGIQIYAETIDKAKGNP